MGVSICWAAAEADTQFNTFDLSALKKQYLIFIFFSSITNCFGIVKEIGVLFVGFVPDNISTEVSLSIRS
jgi:hypothetical protein